MNKQVRWYGYFGRLPIPGDHVVACLSPVHGLGYGRVESEKGAVDWCLVDKQGQPKEGSCLMNDKGEKHPLPLFMPVGTVIQLDFVRAHNPPSLHPLEGPFYEGPFEATVKKGGYFPLNMVDGLSMPATRYLLTYAAGKTAWHDAGPFFLPIREHEFFNGYPTLKEAVGTVVKVPER